MLQIEDPATKDLSQDVYPKNSRVTVTLMGKVSPINGLKKANLKVRHGPKFDSGKRISPTEYKNDIKRA